VTGPDIAVAIECDHWLSALPGVEDQCRRVAAIALASAVAADDLDIPVDRCEISLVLADDALVRGLNAQYRNQDKPTNVLSFAALDDEDAPECEEGPLLLGDVIVAYETTASEAVAEGKTIANHLTHLVAHGVLHLLGYDHQEDDEAGEMEGLERSILSALGVPDPYMISETNAAKEGDARL